MTAFIIRRIGATFVVMAVVGILVFLLLHLSPGDPAAIIAGDNATPAQIDKVVEVIAGQGMTPHVMPGATRTAIARILTTAQVLAAPATAFLVVGVTGLFLRLCQKPSPTMRYISDSAYWMYIVHLPLVVALNWCLYPRPAPALVKFTLVCLAAFAIMLGTYHLFVRYTWIGVLLNGPKLRDQRAQRRAQHTEHRAAHHP